MAKVLAVGYCRFSSENQADGFSIEAQQKAIRKYCEEHKYTLLDFYVDRAYSGTNIDRPGFQKMMNAAEDGKFSVLVVHKYDRFSRSVYDQAIAEKKLNDWGVRLESALEPYDPTSPSSFMSKGIVMIFNQFYSMNLSREVKKGLYEGASEGIAVRVPPIGYTIQDRHYVFSDKADIIKKVFSMYTSGKSMAEIRLATGFSYQKIGHILPNRFYIGDVKVGPNIYPGTAPKLIEEDVFMKAQSILATKAQKSGFRDRKHIAVLSGILFDEDGSSYCSATGKSRSKGRKFYYYRSAKNRKYISEKKLERCAIEGLAQYLETGIDYAKLSTDLEECRRRSLTDNSYEKAQSRLLSLQKRKERLLDAYLDGMMDKPMFSKKNEDLKIEEEQLSAELKGLAPSDSYPISEQEIREGMTAFAEKISSLFQSDVKKDRIELRGIIRVFISKIIYSGADKENPTIKIVIKMPEQKTLKNSGVSSERNNKKTAVDRNYCGSLKIQDGGVSVSLSELTIILTLNINHVLELQC